MYGLVQEPAQVEPAQVEQLKKAALTPLLIEDGTEPDHVILAIQEAIHPYHVGIIRHEKRLKKALAEIEWIRDNLVPSVHAYDFHYLMLANEIRSMVLCAEMFLRSALERKESRLGRLREDYRDLDNINWLKYINLRQDGTQMKIWSEDVPIEKYKLKPERAKFLHPFWQRLQELGYSAKVEK